MTTSTVPAFAQLAATSWQRRAFAEFLGSALLAAIVIGSGIAASALSPGDIGLQLFENAAATALGLYVLIVVLAPLSGAHFNPIVSLVDVALGFRPWRDLASYVPAQLIGCVAGAILANAMFGLPAITLSAQDRLTGPHLLAEVVATAGLVLVIFVLARSGRGQFAPAAVAAYIGSAYFFTSSTSFANPAITIGRMFTDTFAGIGPGSAPGYIGAQLVGGALGLALVHGLYPNRATAPIRHYDAVASTPLRPISEGKA